MRTLSLIAPVVSFTLLAGCVLKTSDEAPPSGESFGEGESELNAQGCMPSGIVDRHALCICEDFDQVGRVSLLRGESDREASLGVNGRSELVSSSAIEGSWYAHGGFNAVTSTSIEGDLVTAHDVTWVGNLSVAGNLVAGGSVDGVGDLSVDGQVQAAGPIVVVGDQDVGGYGDYPGNVAPPCNCEGPQLFDVARAVADARSINDNEAAGIPAGGIAQIGSLTVTLTSGRYYLGDIQSVGNLSLEIDGEVALFVDGSIDTVGNDAITIREGGSLDLYVAGSVQTVGNVAFGSAEDPSAFRLLIGGEGAALVNVGNQAFYGQIYAPEADVDYVGGTQIVGALVARQLVGVGELTVVYGGPVQTPATTCFPPGAGEGESEGEGEGESESEGEGEEC